MDKTRRIRVRRGLEDSVEEKPKYVPGQYVRRKEYSSFFDCLAIVVDVYPEYQEISAVSLQGERSITLNFDEVEAVNPFFLRTVRNSLVAMALSVQGALDKAEKDKDVVKGVLSALARMVHDAEDNAEITEDDSTEEEEDDEDLEPVRRRTLDDAYDSEEATSEDSRVEAMLRRRHPNCVLAFDHTHQRYTVHPPNVPDGAEISEYRSTARRFFYTRAGRLIF